MSEYCYARSVRFIYFLFCMMCLCTWVGVDGLVDIAICLFDRIIGRTTCPSPGGSKIKKDACQRKIHPLCEMRVVGKNVREAAACGLQLPTPMHRLILMQYAWNSVRLDHAGAHKFSYSK